MNATVVLLGSVTTTRGRRKHGHMGRSHSDVGDEEKDGSGKLHDDDNDYGWGEEGDWK